jgi:hypothetical protein
MTLSAAKKYAVFGLLAAILLWSTACGNETATTTSPSSTAATTITALRTTPPSVEELIEGGFASPSIPRITAEQLKILITQAQQDGRYAGSGGMVSWSDFIIIDVRSAGSSTNGEANFSQPGHILGARSMPLMWYWVAGTGASATAGELEAYEREMANIEDNILQLPRNLPIFIYDGTDNDAAACALAEALLAAGFSADNVRVAWKGFNYWYYDLRYPVVQSDYNYEGQ